MRTRAYFFFEATWGLHKSSERFHEPECLYSVHLGSYNVEKSIINANTHLQSHIYYLDIKGPKLQNRGPENILNTNKVFREIYNFQT